MNTPTQQQPQQSTVQPEVKVPTNGLTKQEKQQFKEQAVSILKEGYKKQNEKLTDENIDKLSVKVIQFIQAMFVFPFELVDTIIFSWLLNSEARHKMTKLSIIMLILYTITFFIYGYFTEKYHLFIGPFIAGLILYLFRRKLCNKIK